LVVPQGPDDVASLAELVSEPFDEHAARPRRPMDPATMALVSRIVARAVVRMGPPQDIVHESALTTMPG
jgi:hypothetical protein